MRIPIRGMVLALLAPLVLVGCAFSPGRFTAAMTILADRSFTFSYQGEVIAVDLASEMAKGMGDAMKDAGEAEKKGVSDIALFRGASLQDDCAMELNQSDCADVSSEGDDAEDVAKKEAKFKAIGEALTKEAGYRSVVYKGDGVFVVDYAISGKLTHGFMWPFNLDAEVIVPFVIVELRGKDVVRVKAPAFGDNDSPAQGKASADSKAKLDGTFTLVTDGEIVSQNNGDGATSAGGRRTVVWKATPLSKDAPMAVVKVAPLP